MQNEKAIQSRRILTTNYPIIQFYAEMGHPLMREHRRKVTVSHDSTSISVRSFLAKAASFDDLLLTFDGFLASLE